MFQLLNDIATHDICASQLIFITHHNRMLQWVTLFGLILVAVELSLQRFLHLCPFLEGELAQWVECPCVFHGNILESVVRGYLVQIHQVILLVGTSI